MAPRTTNRAMKYRTISLDADADRYLMSMVPGTRGLGAFLSRLLHEHKLRQELTDKHGAVASKEQWEKDGVCVD
jgi:hypothetical protein